MSRKNRRGAAPSRLQPTSVEEKALTCARITLGLALAEIEGDSKRLNELLAGLSAWTKDEVLKAFARAFVEQLGDLVVAQHGVRDPHPYVLELLRQQVLELAAAGDIHDL